MQEKQENVEFITFELKILHDMQTGATTVEKLETENGISIEILLER